MTRDLPVPPRAEHDGGILAGASRLDLWLHASLTLLVLASVVRYLDGHGLGDRAWLVLPGAALLLAVYVAGHAVRRHPVWLAVLVVLFVGLALLAPSFSWAAVPLVFVALRVLSFQQAVAVTVLLVAVVAAAWTRMTGVLDPTVVLGPACIAVLSVVAYRVLERDATLRRRLLADLEQAQDDVADAERRAGVVAERTRLSREIHDSVAQGLTSINLLLEAAQQDWNDRPETARAHVSHAATAARSSLDEVRRVVRDLAPAELDGRGPAALTDAIRALCERAERVSGVPTDLRIHGDPVPVSGAVATAVLRTARGALANVAEHSRASAATVTLTYLESEVALDVRDDGVGISVGAHNPQDLRGYGLAGIRSRVAELGGELVVESRPGEGTVVAASFPLPRRG
ncbi:sensor histidine kinase [Nocardioides speluncae]|uniref:sensor histidine kinase n=1 Tax=Nocardioides speluncae TaxID=2670337 RepID=UPI000D68DB36|nr:sensor histidine kinase [Nocardioides speluncae]